MADARIVWEGIHARVVEVLDEDDNPLKHIEVRIGTDRVGAARWADISEVKEWEHIRRATREMALVICQTVSSAKATRPQVAAEVSPLRPPVAAEGTIAMVPRPPVPRKKDVAG